MPTYRVSAIKMTGKEPKTRIYRIEENSTEKAELEARKRFAASLGLSSIRNISAFAIRVW